MFQSRLNLVRGQFVLTVDASVWYATEQWLTSYGVEFAKYVRGSGTVKFTIFKAPDKVIAALVKKFGFVESMPIAQETVVLEDCRTQDVEAA